MKKWKLQSDFLNKTINARFKFQSLIFVSLKFFIKKTGYCKQRGKYSIHIDKDKFIHRSVVINVLNCKMNVYGKLKFSFFEADNKQTLKNYSSLYLLLVKK